MTTQPAQISTLVRYQLEDGTTGTVQYPYERDEAIRVAAAQLTADGENWRWVTAD